MHTCVLAPDMQGTPSAHSPHAPHLLASAPPLIGLRWRAADSIPSGPPPPPPRTPPLPAHIRTAQQAHQESARDLARPAAAGLHAVPTQKDESYRAARTHVRRWAYSMHARTRALVLDMRRSCEWCKEAAILGALPEPVYA